MQHRYRHVLEGFSGYLFASASLMCTRSESVSPASAPRNSPKLEDHTSNLQSTILHATPSNLTFPIKPLSFFAEPFSSWSHLLGALVFIPLSWQLFNCIPLPFNQAHICVAVYSTCLIFCLVCSGLYHMAKPFTATRLFLKQVDHAAIFCQIAGTITGIHGVFFTSFHDGFL
ncbi:hypothetical protein GEMRC1_006529 [Eukaryota sp. GEM-RC1]